MRRKTALIKGEYLLMPPLMLHHVVFYPRVMKRQVMVNHLMVWHLAKCMENPNLYTLVDDLVVLHHPVQIMQVVSRLLVDLVYHQAHQWVRYPLKSQLWIPMLRYYWLDLVCFYCTVDIRKCSRVKTYIIIKRYIRLLGSSLPLNIYFALFLITVFSTFFSILISGIQTQS